MFHYRSFAANGRGWVVSRQLDPDRKGGKCRTQPKIYELHRTRFGFVRVELDTLKSYRGLILDPRINKLLEEIPEKPPRSKLEPHADVISALRRKRLTYREIAQFFQDHLAITVAPSTIHDFVRVRRRRGKQNDVSTGEQSATRPNRVSASKLKNIRADVDVQKRISALKQRTPTDAPQPVFTYEEDEPLKLRRNPAPAKID